MSRKILLVDNNISDRPCVLELLTGTGLEIIETRDCYQAVEAAISQHPGIILVAAEMTRLKNYDFFSILQQIPSTRMIPILLFTSNNEKEVPAFCKAKHRPIKIQDLINKIRPYVNAAKSTIIRADI